MLIARAVQFEGAVECSVFYRHFAYTLITPLARLGFDILGLQGTRAPQRVRKSSSPELRLLREVRLPCLVDLHGYQPPGLGPAGGGC